MHVATTYLLPVALALIYEPVVELHSVHLHLTQQLLLLILLAQQRTGAARFMHTLIVGHQTQS